MTYNNKKPTIYCSIDIECDGANLIKNSCIMVGMAFSKPLDQITNYDTEWDYCLYKKEWCIAKEPGTVEEVECMEQFWSQNQECYKYIKDNQQSLEIVTSNISGFIKGLEDGYSIKYIASPTSYDLAWYKYIMALNNQPDYGHTAICISTMLKVADYLGIKREVLNKEIRTENLPHTHFAEDDALEQLYIFLKLKHFFTQGNFETYKD